MVAGKPRQPVIRRALGNFGVVLNAAHFAAIRSPLGGCVYESVLVDVLIAEAKNIGIEGTGQRVVAGVEFVPAQCTVLVDALRPDMGPRLPDAKDCTNAVCGNCHAPRIHHIEGRSDELATSSGYFFARGVNIVRGQIRGPDGWHVGILFGAESRNSLS